MAPGDGSVDGVAVLAAVGADVWAGGSDGAALTGADVAGRLGAADGLGGETLMQPTTAAKTRPARAPRAETELLGWGIRELWTRTLDICFFTV